MPITKQFQKQILSQLLKNKKKQVIIMKLKKTNILILIFIFGCFLISGASAQDTDNLNSTSIETQDISDNNLLTVNESEEIISQ